MAFGRKKGKESKKTQAKRVIQQTENERCPVKGCTKKRNHRGNHGS